MPPGPPHDTARLRRSVRYQVSLAFLACALCLVSCVTGIILAERVVSDRLLLVQTEHRAAFELGRGVDAAYTRLLLAAVAEGSSPGALFPEETVSLLAADLATNLQGTPSSLAEDLDAFIASARSWWVSGRAIPPRFLPPAEHLAESFPPPQEDESPGAGTDVKGESSLPAGDSPPLTPSLPEVPASLPVDTTPFLTMDDAYRRFRLDLGRLSEASLKATRDEVVRWTPLAVATPLALGLLAVFSALRMRTLISDPVDALTAAAQAITRGHESVEIPSIDPTTEFGVLADALRQMRQHLALTIDDLAERNDRLRTLFDSMPEGALLVDGEGRVSAMNLHVNALLGLTGPRRLTVGSEISPDGAQRLPSQPPKGMDSQEISVMEGDDAPPRTTHIVRRPLSNADGHSRGYVAILHDLTREKETEQVKNDFLSIVTHELKTPLTGIEGYTRLLMLGRAGPLTDQQKEFLQIIHRQSQTLRDMIQELLDISRISAGRMQYTFAPTDAALCCEKVVESHRATAQERGLELRYERSGEPQPAVVSADAQRLEQVVGNLLGNACKFTPTGGRITVRCILRSQEVEIAVEDNGRGIPERDLERVFEKFHQVDHSDTRKAGGVGLGLYICKEIVTAHSGSIQVDSEVGRGSTFVVRLARSAVPVPSEEAAV